MSSSFKRTALYANLLDGPSDSGQGQGSNNQDGDASAKNKLNDALRFQPRRPQQSTTKPKPKVSAIRAAASTATSAIGLATASAPTVTDSLRTESLSETNNGGVQARSTTIAADPEQVSRPTIDDWAAVDDDIEYFADKKTLRGGRKKKNKRENGDGFQYQDWTDIYDPSRPNTFEEFIESEERWNDEDEWRCRLYAHRRRDGSFSLRDRSPDGSYRGSDGEANIRPPFGDRPARFAPPAEYGASLAGTAKNSRPTADVSMSADVQPTQDDFQQGERSQDEESEKKETQPINQVTICRDPVRYSSPVKDVDEPDRPSAAARPTGFGERILEKHGWVKGTGLGASGDGITKPLQVKMNKGKDKNMTAGIAGTGRIVGGHRGAKQQR